MKFLSLISLLFIVTACNNKKGATELYFTEQEAGVPSYKTRMIVTDDFLRIDDGEEAKDFILYDRKQRKISSITYDNHRIFEITHRPMTLKKPDDLKWDHKEKEAEGAPTIDGIKPTGHSFSANDQVCLQVMAAKGLLDQARLALIEYQTTLAGEHAANLNKTPKDQQVPCDTALSIFHATDSLQYGFPIIEWDSAGHHRQLTNYTENKELLPELFKIPKGYESFSLNK